ncbi:DNA helicase RecG, partial [Pantanalinema rosaneae CENA516]
MMDWNRLQKALSKEAEHGFNDLQGNYYRFSEFLSLTLNQPAGDFSFDQQRRLQDFGSQFTTYSELSFHERQHLVAETRRYLQQMQRVYETKPEGSPPPLSPLPCLLYTS